MSISPSQDVDGPAFVAAVGDTVASLEMLAEAYYGVGERFGYTPGADSVAVAELAAGRGYTNDHWPDPVAESHSASGMLAFAGVDHLRSYAQLFVSPPIPVYAHLVVARAALEAFGWARWLADRRIGVEGRIKRDRVYQLGDGLQRKRFPEPAMKAKGVEIIDRVRSGAPRGWVIVASDRTVSVGGEAAPAPRDLISDVLTTGGPSPTQLGAGLWSMLSGVAHSVRYALLYSMEMAPRVSEVEPLLAGMVTNSSTVHLIGAAVARAAITACTERLGLMGWVGDGSWQEGVDRAERQIAAVLRATEPPP